MYINNVIVNLLCFFFKQKTAYEMRISDWSSDVCSSDLPIAILAAQHVNFPLPHLEIQAARLHIGIGAFLLQTLDFRIPRDTIVQPVDDGGRDSIGGQIGRATCRERVCQYV